MKSAFYEKEITPPIGYNLPGYFNFRGSTDIIDRLYAKALVVENGEKIAIVAIDALFATDYMRKPVVERINRYTGIKEDNILFAANHTHTAIPLYDGLVEFDQTGLDSYLETICALIADCAILADKRLEESSAKFGLGNVEGIAFCRNYYMKNSTPTTNPGRMNPNIEGPVTDVDTELPVLFFEDKYGNPKGALISYALHQDCVGGEEISGDYSSILSQELKKVYGEDFVSVFLIGACGNVNHLDVNKKEDAPDHYKKIGKIIAGEVVKTAAKAERINANEIKSVYKTLKIKRLEVSKEELEKAENTVKTVKLKEGVKIAADDTDPEQYALAMAKILINHVNGPEEIDAPLQVIKIGDFTLYCFPGEIFNQYSNTVKNSSNTDKKMVATVCNASVGYVPTTDMFYPTIYESLPGSCKLNKNAGKIMADELIKLGSLL